MAFTLGSLEVAGRWLFRSIPVVPVRRGLFAPPGVVVFSYYGILCLKGFADLASDSTGVRCLVVGLSCILQGSLTCRRTSVEVR